MKEKAIWNSIWSLKVPHKIRIFLWKIMHEGIPVRANLKHRIPNIDDSYPRCGVSAETVLHCLISCSHSSAVWNLAPTPTIALAQEQNLFVDWWSVLLNRTHALDQIAVTQ